MAIAVNLYSNGPESEVELPLAEISEVVSAGEALLWIDVIDPTSDDYRILAEEFGFHPLAMEDVQRQDIRPEIDFYDGYYYMIFYAINAETMATRIDLIKVSFLVGKSYIVTIHEQELPAFADIKSAWKGAIEEVGNRGLNQLLYALLDSIVDDYFPAVDAISDRIDALESEIFTDAGRASFAKIFELKKQLISFRRLVAPERDVMNSLIRWDSGQFDRQTAIYFQDVYDHLLRVLDNLDSFRDLMSNNLDAYLAMTSNRLNRTVKTLTASSIILMGMTLIASIYGMNFTNIPELDWAWGYWWALGLMAAVGIALGLVFRRLRWF